jgi:hypothetical protein
MLVTIIDVDEMQVSCIIIVLERNNFARMEKADPITLLPKARGGSLAKVKYNDLRMLLAFEEDIGPLTAAIKEGGLQAGMKYLLRGYQTHPEDGLSFHFPEDFNEAN